MILTYYIIKHQLMSQKINISLRVSLLRLRGVFYKFVSILTLKHFSKLYLTYNSIYYVLNLFLRLTIDFVSQLQNCYNNCNLHTINEVPTNFVIIINCNTGFRPSFGYCYNKKPDNKPDNWTKKTYLLLSENHLILKDYTSRKHLCTVFY